MPPRRPPTSARPAPKFTRDEIDQWVESRPRDCEGAEIVDFLISLLTIQQDEWLDSERRICTCGERCDGKGASGVPGTCLACVHERVEVAS